MKLKNFTSYILSLLLGLITAQIISTIFVYIANIELYHSISLISDNGYITVPSLFIKNTLKTFMPAFCGGLFFTLTSGIFLSVMAICFAGLSKFVSLPKRTCVISMVIIFAICLILINSKGAKPLITCYFVLIPIVVFFSFLYFCNQANDKKKQVQKSRNQEYRIKFIAIIISFILFLLISSMQFNEKIFFSIRDKLLFSNNIGLKINNFYYQYTLYAANVFKTLNQKITKTCIISGINDKILLNTIKQKLLNNDYIPTQNNNIVNLKIIKKNDIILLLDNKDKILLTTKLNNFLDNTFVILSQFSKNNDGYFFFRKITLVSLFLVLSLSIYFALYIFMWLILYCFCSSFFAYIISAISCPLICLIFFIISSSFFSLNINNKNIDKFIASNNPQKRIAALQYIAKHKFNIKKYNYNLKDITLKKPAIAETYWYARSLSYDCSLASYKELFKLMNNNQFNITCMALYSLGEKTYCLNKKNLNKSALNKTIKIFTTSNKWSNNWYVQWYAYKAARKLGWIQKKLGLKKLN